MRGRFDVQAAVLFMEEAANGARAPIVSFAVYHSAARCGCSVQCLHAIRVRLELRAVRRALRAEA